MFLRNIWNDYIFQGFTRHILLCCGYFPLNKFILFFVVESSWTKKPKSAVSVTCFDIRAFKASTLQAAFFHQGNSRYFFVQSKQYLSKVHGSCPLHCICSTDWKKGAKIWMLLRGLGIPARPLRKTDSTSSKKVSIEVSQFLQKFRIEKSVSESFPSESWCSEKLIVALYIASFRTSYSRCSVTTCLTLSIKTLI